MTYYNMAVELEHLNQLEDSLGFYNKANDFVQYLSIDKQNGVFLIQKNIEDAVK